MDALQENIIPFIIKHKSSLWSYPWSHSWFCPLPAIHSKTIETLAQHHCISQHLDYCILNNKPRSRKKKSSLLGVFTQLPISYSHDQRTTSRTLQKTLLINFFLSVCSIRTTIHKNIDVIKDYPNL